MRALGSALVRKEIYFLIIYFLIDGFTSPSFSDFTYFFLMNVVGISKFMYAMMTLIGQVCQVIGVLMYNQFLKNIEVRTVIFWNVVIAIIGAAISYAFAMRWNLEWGINDYFLLIFTDVVFNSLATSFGVLPIMALFVKIIPRGIEGTMFAFLTGTTNFDNGIIQPMMGALINDEYVGVDKDD